MSFLCSRIVFILMSTFGSTFRSKTYFILFSLHKCFSYIKIDLLKVGSTESYRFCGTFYGPYVYYTTAQNTKVVPKVCME